VVREEIITLEIKDEFLENVEVTSESLTTIDLIDSPNFLHTDSEVLVPNKQCASMIANANNSLYDNSKHFT